MSFVFFWLLACCLRQFLILKKIDGEVNATGEGTLCVAYLKSICTSLNTVLDIFDCKLISLVFRLENGVIRTVQTFIEYSTN